MSENLKKEELNATEVAVEQVAEKANVTVEKETAESLLAQEGLEGGFKIKRANHNLERCRSQLKLVSSIEEQMNDMMNLLKN